MNKIYNPEFARVVKEITKFDEIIARIDKDPSVIDTLSLEELIRLNCYYEKIIRQKQDKLNRLKNSIPPSDQ